MLADSKEENTYSLFGKAVLTDNAEEAIDLYTKFIEKTPKYGLGEAYFNRGFKYFLLEKSELAVSDFNEAVKLGVKDPYLYYFRGASLVALEEYDKAIESFTTAIKMDSSFELAYVMRGNRYFSKKDYSKALNDYNKAIELNSKDDFLYIMRGRTYEALGDYKKALNDWQKVKKMGGENVETADKLIERLNEKIKEKK
jgi:tetratricopeptide (TPR) repeat protein